MSTHIRRYRLLISCEIIDYKILNIIFFKALSKKRLFDWERRINQKKQKMKTTCDGIFVMFLYLQNLMCRAEQNEVECNRIIENKN